MSKISRTRGKSAELQVAHFWNGKRNHFESEDIQHPLLSIEVKARTSPPAMIAKWYSQARAACPDCKIPVVQIHEMGADYTTDLCLIRASDLRDLLGGAR